MAAASWDEIKRLAADFQRAQLSSTVQRLSERNCVEIIQKLQALKLIEVIYTTDGKEYLTPEEIDKEIKEELQINGGRVNLVKLQQSINVDLSHIENRINEVLRSEKGLTLINGHLISQSYLETISEEINDKLQEQGQVTIAELTKIYDLPGDFLLQAIERRIGRIIYGQLDPFEKNVIFTKAFVDRHTAKIRGAFSALTKPTSVMGVMNRFQLQERLFKTILENLIQCERLAGSISGGQAQYVPDIYTRSQNEWVDSFYKQNGYLEYDALSRLGISDAKSFIKKRFKDEPMMYLGTCCLGSALQERVEAEVEEALSTDSWTDVMPSLPSVFSESDINQVLHKCIKSKSGARVFCDTIVASENLIGRLSKPFADIMNSKAEIDVRTSAALLVPEGGKLSMKAAGLDDGGRDDRREQRKKKAAGTAKSGGGTQGREVKMKSTKKKYMKGKDLEEHGEETSKTSAHGHLHDLEFLSVDEISEELRQNDSLDDCTDEFLTEIAQQLYRPLTKQYREVVKSVFLQSAGTSDTAGRKKIHGELSEKVNGLYVNANLFEKGASLFTDETQIQLGRHLLRTVCSDITNLLVTAVAADHMLAIPEDSHLTVEMRLKLLSQMPDDKTKNLLTKLHLCLNGKNLEDFFDQLSLICGSDYMGIALRKADKKKERQLVFSHKQALAEQLREENDAAMGLHLAAVLLFQVFTQCMVHAPGRCVPQIISFLKQSLSPEQHATLVQCQELVVKQVKLQSDGGGDADEVSRDLQELLPTVKDIALNARRSTAPATEPQSK